MKKCERPILYILLFTQFFNGEVGAGEMDATCVAGGISGRVLFFGVGASQIGIFAAHFAAESRIPPATQAGRVAF